MRLFLLLPILIIEGCGRSAPVVQHAFDPDVYIVQTGDTVYSISWRYAQDHRDVIRWNNLRDPYIIHPGQKLRVRPSTTQAQAAQQPTTAPAKTQSVAVAKPLKKAQPIAAQQPLPKAAVVQAEPAPAAKSSGESWTWPTRGAILSKFSKNSLDKQGIDIRGNVGAPVLASRSGKVVYSGAGLLSYGRLVIIKHSDTFLSAYAYNSRLLVNEGDVVQGGQAIAQIGTDNQGTAKLHFEIRRNGKPVDPLQFLPTN